jgi:hypothetical protein
LQASMAALWCFFGVVLGVYPMVLLARVRGYCATGARS